MSGAPAKVLAATVDEIIARPERAHGLPRQERRKLLARIQAAHTILTDSLVDEDGDSSERWLTIEEAAQILHVEPTWIYRRSRKLDWVVRREGLVRVSFLLLQEWMRKYPEASAA